MSTATAAKERGNTSFKDGDYPAAIGHYTEAIFADRTNPTYPLNRAAAYLKLGKLEDAERDCTTVLTLEEKNAKARFRRGQARVGLGKLLEASDDFKLALKLEPANQTVKDELRKVTEAIEKKKKSSSDVGKSPNQDGVPKRRRVPIKIIEAPAISGSTSTSARIESGSDKPQSTKNPQKAASSEQNVKSTATLPIPTAKSPDSDMMTPVSSRSLKGTTPVKVAPYPNNPVPIAAPSNSEIRASISSPKSSSSSVSPPQNSAEPRPSTFKDAKQIRESSKQSRVGGGIFRASGRSTVFSTRDVKDMGAKSKEAAAGPTESQPAPPQAPAKERLPRPPIPSPKSLFDLSKAWGMYPSVEERWEILSSIPPCQISALCKASLEPSLLVSMLQVFLVILKAASDENDPAEAVRAYMESLAAVPRFATLVLFLSEKEKEIARDVWHELDVDEPPGLWASVGA